MLSNPRMTKTSIVNWIQKYFHKNSPRSSAVVGISGGKDSTIVAGLCVEALGKDRVVGVLMPNGYQSDIDDSYRVIQALGIQSMIIDIQKAYESLISSISMKIHVTDQAKINLPPRLRMSTLYAIAQSLPDGGLVANTCNRSEDYVGYSTKFGDGAGDFSPLGNLVVHEVLQIGYEIATLPRDLIVKIPSDGLCGKTDEDNLGFKYEQLDQYILTGSCGDAEIDKKIIHLHERNLHKLKPIPTFKLIDYIERN